MNEPPESFIYLPELQADGTDANILVRSQLPPATVIADVRAAARSLDSKVQPLETDTLDGLLKQSMFANRTAASLASVLGVLGTLLAALGIYGVAAGVGIHKLIVSTPLSRKIYGRMSLLQYVTMQIFLVTMLFLPIKILLRLMFTMKYVLVTPWFNV